MAGSLRNTWCPACQDDCHDHATICTTCGTPLIAYEGGGRREEESVVRPLQQQQQDLQQEVVAGAAELRVLLSNLRQQVRQLRDSTRMEVNQPLTTGTTDAMRREQRLNQLAQLLMRNDQDGWQTAPAEAMDPHQARPRSRPTSKAALENLPRIVLEHKSSLLYQATIRLEGLPRNNEFQAVLGDFGPTHSVSNAKWLIASPKTGKGGLSHDTNQQIQNHGNCILYMERGDGISFVEKALMAQEAGASAVVIGNNASTPWPYIMKDSKGEASSLLIPVVMVQQGDGQSLAAISTNAAASALFSIQIERSQDDCVICRDAFEISQTVTRLPACGHVFHEACALAWLTHHNACPYCRRELPTDDAEYESERRRLQRTHAGTEQSSSSLAPNWQDFYG